MSAEDPRLRDHPGGFMLTYRISAIGGPTSTYQARCDACGVESTYTAAHGDSLRQAFEACTTHNNTHHPEVPEGALF